jgi:hypothetical protein
MWTECGTLPCGWLKMTWSTVLAALTACHASARPSNSLAKPGEARTTSPMRSRMTRSRSCSRNSLPAALWRSPPRRAGCLRARSWPERVPPRQRPDCHRWGAGPGKPARCAISASPDATIELNIQRLDEDTSGNLVLQAQASVSFKGRRPGPLLCNFRFVVTPPEAGIPGEVNAISTAVAVCSKLFPDLAPGMTA